MKTKTEPKKPDASDSLNLLVRPWVGNLHHARELCDDWGCLRDEAGERIFTISLPERSDETLNVHRRNKTDPTQEIVDYLLEKLNQPNEFESV